MNIPNVRGHKVYNNADSKDVENYVLYCGEETAVNDCNFLYFDPEFTQPVCKDEMIKMFMQGVIVCWVAKEENLFGLYKPVNCVIHWNEDIEWACYHIADCDSEAEVVRWSVVSKEYVVGDR